jgi:hypothetical protein
MSFMARFEGGLSIESGDGMTGRPNEPASLLLPGGPIFLALRRTSRRRRPNPTAASAR